MARKYSECMIMALNKVMRKINERRENDPHIKLIDTAFMWNSSYREYCDLFLFSNNYSCNKSI